MAENKNRRPEGNPLGATTRDDCQTKGYDLSLNDNWVFRWTVLTVFALVAAQWLAVATVLAVIT